ncbi:putative apsB protein [Coleophoma crateriformis]|uniref:Putative apsB protein n=1 Tax=Coleophoma crateriformis TaxID=565419 RepID=A0A3D8RWG0_9HELO|nr:putative apsB protein [Coleophoma crateriformis]
MAEEEEHSDMAAEERPQTALKDSRKIPGGFGADDVDDLSPTKMEFEDSIFTNAKAVAQNNRMPSLGHGSLPSLPPPHDSSLLYNHSENDELMELDEKEMQRHLNDVESSFLPALSPIAPARPGGDDTYLSDSEPQEVKGRLSSIAEVNTPNKNTDEDLPNHGRKSPPTPDNAYQTPGVTRPGSPDPEHSSLDEDGNTTSALETMSSSPTAAAAARTISRAVSAASTGRGYEPADDTAEENLEPEDLEATPRRPRNVLQPDADSSDGQSTVRHHASSQSLADAGSTPGHGLLPSRSRRPKFLKSRHASQRSSQSSFITNPDSQDEDNNYGADYALQSGGAVPGHGTSRTSSAGLSRSVSLGSMASGVDDSGNESAYQGHDRSLATLTEEERNRERKMDDDEPAAPETPRANSRTLAAPTDTIIARHVRNVHVPESLVKEYRNKSGVSSPNKRSSFSATSLGKSGRNLTLKEQSSTIERLSKENFDLKLKVMFLSDRLDKLSEEGVKEMISENVELKTGLAVMQRDNKALRRKIKELEKQLKENEGRPDTARSGTSTEDQSPQWFDQEGAQEREEELIYLRERVEEYATEIEKLRKEGITRENEKRNLAEVVRNIGERQGQNLDAREEMDVWKDLLEQETARREQSDEDNKKLRDEIFRLKTEVSANGMPGLNHTTNIYNITKKRTMSPSRESRPGSELSGRIDDRNGAFSQASTLADELRREAEQLRHENAELRREVGAQTSMLTSRRREKELLYQEIEDLKLGQRRAGGSVAGESIFERSASRAGAHVRSSSRMSAATRQTGLSDAEREEYENKNAELRDKMNSLKLQSQELERELDSCMADFEMAAEQKKNAEVLVEELQEALDVAESDLLTMQTDRDEALQGQEEAENMFDALRKEAQEELDGFAAEMDEANQEIERLHGEVTDTTENFNALQNEMRSMSEALVRLEDDQETHLKRIQELEKELEEANKELEQMETNLVEANGKINRLTVQQESSQGEITFLREEQDNDKIKMGDMEAAIRNLEQNLQEERSRGKELEQRLEDERHQRDVVAAEEKEEVQAFVNDLNREASDAKDEARRLRKILTSKEVEAAEWKERLTELESNLREALGDLGGTRSSFLKSIAKLQRELENTIRDFDSTKASLAEKERIIKQRDALLESHGLESRKLAEMLDKERQSHRTTKHTFETYQKTQQHTSRTLTQQESRVLELETSRAQDRKKMAQLEATFKEQLTERNNVLLNMWNRLSALCGTDWTHNNSLINGRALPSLEAVSTMLPGFSKNLLGAVKHLESIITNFKSQIRTVERDLWKEYQNLEYNLDVRSKRIDRLEVMTKSGIPIFTDGKAEITKLRDVNKSLKTEVSSLRAAMEVQSRAYEEHGSPAPSIPTGPRTTGSRSRTSDKSRASTMTRHSSNTTAETIERLTTAGAADEEYKPDLRWQVRLQELEYKLKAEREARKLDRSSARQRLEEKSRENAELAAELERERIREEMRNASPP